MASTTAGSLFARRLVAALGDDSLPVLVRPCPVNVGGSAAADEGGAMAMAIAVTTPTATILLTLLRWRREMRREMCMDKTSVLRCPIYYGQGPPSRIGDDLNGELVSSKRGSYSPEFKEAAVREVIDQSRPIADVARRLGLVEQTLGTWVKAFRAEHVGEAESELPVSVRARVKELEREVRELRMENEFLGKSVAFFAKKFR